MDVNFNAAISGQCRIQRGSSSAVGTPTFNGATQTNYSCVANENCNYDVHVISNYEGDYNHGFGPVTRSGTTNVRINVRGQVHRPLVLVFVSYEPVNWILSLSSGVTIEKVLLVSQFAIVYYTAIINFMMCMLMTVVLGVVLFGQLPCDIQFWVCTKFRKTFLSDSSLWIW